MGLLDVLNGMQNGPRGQSAPSAPGGSGGGMSPMTMALLGLLAYKTIKSFSSGQPGASPAYPGGGNVGGGAPRGGNVSGGAPGGGLGNLLQTGLGGLLAGGAGGAMAGSVLSGGLSDLLRQFQQSGHGEAANSWVGNGPNKSISPNDLAKALGADQIDALAAHSGMSREELLAGLSQNLPDVVNQLTPDGRLPSAEEAARLL
jgi:uncharacterized protein YidB (DUF937 family)